MVNHTTDTGSKMRNMSPFRVFICGIVTLRLTAFFYSYEVNTNYGTAADLLALSKALHARDMYLMVDIVVNNMVCTIPVKFENLSSRAKDVSRRTTDPEQM